jgi:L-fucose isomerase-like protein
MKTSKSTFALFFGNRGFFPASLIAQARQELSEQLQAWGYPVIMMDAGATRYGAVETAAEGQQYANFLRENRGKFDGIILCLPNFGDENGAIAALKEAGVPILVQAYPDDPDKMAPALRRDAFCGKLSIMDVFGQCGVKFTALKPHVVKVTSPAFQANVDHFDRVCRVVKGMRGMVVGAIGARTTAFKTVRIDELTLQRHDITVETLDLSEVIDKVRSLPLSSPAYQEKRAFLQQVASWEGVPERAGETLARLGVVLDGIIASYHLDALALRCWVELQTQLGISPCVLMGALNDANFAASCEVDTGNAITMHALRLASGQEVACLDWNNNYAENEDKCILFHCGPVPNGMMVERGHISDHLILKNSVGEGCGYGCNVGRIKPTDFTFGSLLTADSRLKFYLGQGRITTDPIADDFFGCAGVAHIEHLQDVLLHIGRTGHRHHTSITPGHVMAPAVEALRDYLGFEVSLPQGECA